ncbi:MAG: hypothetical protein IJ583_11700, partial [Firmicutes bacterium]|nr:hypothetical protein [Bacillota bacterium]
NAKEDLEIKSEIIEFPKVSDHKLYIDMLKNFTDAINYGEKLIAPGREGVGALLLTNGAYISEKKMCRIELEEIIE